MLHVRILLVALSATLVSFLTLNISNRHTKPGGWVEFKDWDLHIVSSDDSLSKDSYLYQYHKLMVGAIETMHREYAPGPKLKKWAEEAGYVNVTETIIPLPIGMWPKNKKLVRRFRISSLQLVIHISHLLLDLWSRASHEIWLVRIWC